MARKPMAREEFAEYKLYQYCDNSSCTHYNQVGTGNLITHSIRQGQIRCGSCHGKPFSVRKGTMFFHLRTSMDRIVTCLLSLTSGMGMNAVCEVHGVCGVTLRSWLLLASQQVEAFTTYLQKDLVLTEIQIDEFWSYIKKKTKT